MMDGSTDLSGDEQEAVYVRISVKGFIIERFLGIGSPKSTTSKHLEELVITMLLTIYHKIKDWTGLKIHIIDKKGALESQPQVIKFTSGRRFSPGTPASSTTKTG
jgi:ribosomal protein L5